MNDERRDDEIIGRALSRAIETIDVSETPYERSRIATKPVPRRLALWQLGMAAAAVLFAVALGTWFTRPTEGQPSVAASPTASPNSVAPSPTTTPPPAVVAPSQDRAWVYFARDGLPPTGAFVSGTVLSGSPESRIASRITALGSAAAVSTGASEVPTGTTTALTLPASRGIAVRVQNGLATVEFNIPDGWGVQGSAQSFALLQQLVYTITEEPGIKRALITETGKPHAVIDQLVVDKPLTREDVSGYVGSQGSGPASTITSGGTATRGLTLATSYSVDAVAPGLARFVVTLTGPDGAAATLPSFSAYLDRTEQPDFGKASIYLELGAEPNPTTGVTVVDRSPLRAIRTVNGFGSPVQVGGPAFVLGLDDARPWRVFTLSNPARIVIDIGGPTQSVSDRIAVYRAQPSAATPVCSNTCDVQLSGAARVFEANVVWRVKDTAGKVIAKGQFLASLGSSPVWGTFDTSIQVPSTFRGNATLEVYEASAKDGSEQGLVQIPLVIR